MTQITLNIKENKVEFFMELIKNFDFVKLGKEDYTEQTKEAVKENIKQGLKELQLIEQGEMKATPLKDFLNEL
ncbi:MAG: hypothetical protein WCX31_19640 [Salinivirgaceae bacterium]|jgi:hypothetical protein